MKKLSLLLVTLLMFNFSAVMADEGMWLLSLLGKNYEQMKQQGFKLTPEDVYNVNQGCLKDAVVGLGSGNAFWHFCTGEIISDEGLFSTNHHCGFSMIQSHATVEHDYLQDGFWAMTRADELPNEGTTAALLIRMEDVTDQLIAAGLKTNMSWKDKKHLIDSISSIITKQAVEGTIYDAQVADMFAQNQFFLLVYVLYKDVRLVGAPPQSMGKFGGDTDNWEWPRHTADFSMFRIYTDKNGNPAEYSKDNIPLKPKHFFPVSVKGIKEGDFAMIMGYPGTTNRFLTSYGLEETMNVTNDLRFNIRDVKIHVLREEMAKDQQVRIQYASKYASCSNYWKYSLQQNKALKNLNTMGIKQDIEKQYSQWAANQTDPNYSKALSKIKNAYAGRRDLKQAQSYLLEGLLQGPELLYFSFSFMNDLFEMADTQDKDSVATLIAALNQSIDEFYKDFNLYVEKRLLTEMITYTYNNMDKKYYPDFFVNTIDAKFKGNIAKFVDKTLAKSFFVSKDALYNALSNVKLKDMLKDPVFVAGQSAYLQYRKVAIQSRNYNNDLEEGQHYFTDGILQINKEKALAPDANSTIRLTYGNIKEYDPKDGVTYHYYTTLAGVMEKEDPNNSEFIVPAKLKELYKAKDYGIYANDKGELPVCFLTNNDITGGNSGSPVLDAEGNLIGLAFDGNSEAMSGDIDFEENLQRCINLDVRYMLFIIDKYAGATHLIKEMKIVQ